MTAAALGVDVAGLRYAVRAGGDGPALLLLHGFTGSAAAWAPHQRALRAVARTFAVDLPGHGRTRPPGGPGGEVRASVERTADDLAAILDRLAGGRADVLGYSLGARVALRMAVAHPDVVRRLVLESPAAGIADPAERAARRAADEARAAILERDGIEPFVDAWEREPVLAGEAALPPATRARLRAARLGGDPRGLATSLRAAGQGAMEPLHDRLSGIGVPTLVIVGADDPARARGEAVAAGIPAARLAVVPGVGHAPHLEAPRAFRALVLDFISEAAA